MKKVLAFLLCLFPSLVLAQGNPILQSGNLTPRHLLMGIANGVAGDAGPALGGPLGTNPSELGITNTGTPLCITDAAITGPYHQLCFGANALGGGLLSYNAYRGAPQLPFTCNINGVLTSCLTPVSGSLIEVPNNVQLKALVVPFAVATVYREGFYNPGDGGAAFYTFSPNPCSINTPVGDNGLQVKPNVGTGCWNADFSVNVPTPLIWGASGNGVADDTAMVQAAISAVQGKGIKLNIGTAIYKITGTLANSLPINIFGSGGGGIYTPTCRSGLRYGSPNFTLIAAGATIDIENICIDNGSQTNTSGAAISIIGTFRDSSIVQDSQINNACIGIDISGVPSGQNTESLLDGNVILPSNASGCIGIRVGSQTTGGNTPDTRILNNTVYCGISGAGELQTGMLFLDAGGPFVQNNEIFACNIGTYFLPGANQTIQFGFFNNTILGDSSTTNDFKVDTASVSAQIINNKFTSTWASSSYNGASVLIQNTAAGVLSGLHFINHQSLPFTNQYGFDIKAGFSITIGGGSLVCGKTGTTDIHITGGFRTNIQNSTIGSCDGSTSGPDVSTIGIDIESASHFDGIIQGNDLTGTVTPIVWNPASQDTSGNIIRDNSGLDNIQGMVTSSSATITLPVNPVVLITDTTPITTMNTVWGIRDVTLIAGAGGLSFAGGGNILNALSASSGTLVYATYIGGSGWRLK